MYPIFSDIDSDTKMALVCATLKKKIGKNKAQNSRFDLKSLMFVLSESRGFQSVIKYARIEQMTIPNEPVKLAMTPIHDRPLRN